MRSRTRSAPWSSILHHVAGESVTVFAPALPIKPAVLIAFRGSVPHPQSVMSIVMREKALPAERQHTLQAFQIGVDGMKMFKEIARVDWISLRKPLNGYIENGSRLTQAHGVQRLLKERAQIAVRHAPDLILFV